MFGRMNETMETATRPAPSAHTWSSSGQWNHAVRCRYATVVKITKKSYFHCTVIIITSFTFSWFHYIYYFMMNMMNWCKKLSITITLTLYRPSGLPKPNDSVLKLVTGLFAPQTSRPSDYSPPQLGRFALKSRRPQDNSPTWQLAPPMDDSLSAIFHGLRCSAIGRTLNRQGSMS